MPAYGPPGVTDVCNLALLEIGAQTITDIDDLNGESPAACRAAFWQTVREVGRAHNWNCLKLRKNLTMLSFPQSSSSECTSIGWPGCQPSSLPPYWAANTVYAGGDLVTWGEAIYYSLYAQTSSTNFTNDVSAGLWAQIYSTFLGNNRGNAPGLYEWRFGFALPADFLLVDELNGNNCRNGVGVGSLYELYINQVANADFTVSSGSALFCNTPYADLKYTALIQDPTLWDPLFIGAVAVLLGSKIATQIRGDDGKMATLLRQRYDNEVLPRAKLKDAGERKFYRYDPTNESNFLKSRYGSTNG